MLAILSLRTAFDHHLALWYSVLAE